MSAERVNYQNFGEGKNSPLRLHTAKQMRNVALKFHEKFPKVKPNHVSAFGAASVLAGGALIESQNRRQTRSKAVVTIGAGLQAVGYFCDGLDGALKRIITEVSPDIELGEKGPLVDLVMDKTQEIGLGVMRAKTAIVRGTKIGRLAADAVSTTTVVPSEIREGRVEKGIVIDEVGNVITFLGSRPGRIIFNTVSSLAPRLQPLSDGLGAAANINTSLHRLKAPHKKDSNGFSDEEKAIARKKKQSMHIMEAAAIGRAVYSQIKVRRVK